MFIDYEWKAGLVFGLDTDLITMMDEGDVMTFDAPQSTSINLYLGIVVIHFIF
jgi:hypothetical protein